jgi:hypothetical protein
MDRIRNAFPTSSVVAARSYHSDGAENTILLALFTAVT